MNQRYASILELGDKFNIDHTRSIPVVLREKNYNCAIAMKLKRLREIGVKDIGAAIESWVQQNIPEGDS